MKSKEKVVEIHVTKKDIKAGIPCEPDSCAVALACSRKFKTMWPNVDRSFLELEAKSVTSSLGYVGKLPTTAKKFVEKFDAFLTGEDAVTVLKPFKFKVTLQQVG